MGKLMQSAFHRKISVTCGSSDDSHAVHGSKVSLRHDRVSGTALAAPQPPGRGPQEEAAAGVRPLLILKVAPHLKVHFGVGDF